MNSIPCRNPHCQAKFPSQISEERHFGQVHSLHARWRRYRWGTRCPVEDGACDGQIFRDQGSMRHHFRSVHGLSDAEWRPLLPSSPEFRAIRQKKVLDSHRPPTTGEVEARTNGGVALPTVRLQESRTPDPVLVTSGKTPTLRDGILALEYEIASDRKALQAKVDALNLLKKVETNL